MSKPQRRKGNAKAASSSQAASLLASAGHNVPFVGFDGGFTNVFQTDGTETIVDIDDEVKIILKKLTKKDPQTREKALREFLSILRDKDEDALNLCFTHYASMFDKLCLDGSSIVRSLSLKVLAHCLIVLKKSAQKHLKTVMPFVIISTCDISNTVSNQAESMINEVFGEAKREQVLKLFQIPTATVCVEIISNKHPLVIPQKYDEEEEGDQREIRLSVQSLQCLSRLSPHNSTEFSSIVGGLVSDTATMKRVLKGSGNMKVALLSVVTQLPDCISYILDSPLAAWILSSIDSTDSSIGIPAFDAFILLGGDDRFYSKFDLKKAVVPRLLAVIRKKQSHWRYVGPFLLPSLSLISSHCQSADLIPILSSLLDSFCDNLPLESSTYLHSWISSLTECVKFVLSREDTVAASQSAIRLILSCLDIIENDNEDIQSIAASCVVWIVDKSCLSQQDISAFTSTLLLNMVNRRPSSDSMLSYIFSHCQWKLRNLHADVLRLPPLRISFLTPLLTASDEYIQFIDKASDLMKRIRTFTVDCTEQERIEAAKVYLKVLSAVPEHGKEKFDSSSIFNRILLEESTDDEWNILCQSMGMKRIDYIEDCMVEWAKNNRKKLVTKMLNRIKMEERQNVVRLLLDKTDPSMRNVLGKILMEVDLSTDLRSKCANMLYHGLFDLRNEEEDIRELLSVLADHIPSEAIITQTVPSFIDLPGVNEENITSYASSISKLLSCHDSYKHILPTRQDLDDLLHRTDQYLLSELVYMWSLMPSTSDEHPEETPRELCFIPSENDLLHLVESVTKRSMLYLGIDYQGECMSMSKAYCTTVYTMLAHLSETRFIFGGLPEIAHRYLILYREYLQKNPHLSTETAEVFLSMEWVPPTGLMVLRCLAHEIPSEWQKEGKAKRLDVYWALRWKGSKVKASSTERWLTRFHCEDSPLELLTHLHESMSLNSDDDNCLFSAQSSTSCDWRMSSMFLCAAVKVVSSVPLENLSSELVDFILCNMVSGFQSCDEELKKTVQEQNSLLEAVTAQVLDLFITCADIADKGENEKYDVEFNEFYYPTVALMIASWFITMKAENNATPYNRNLCRAVMKLKDVDMMEKVSISHVFTPELDTFNYKDDRQTLIVHTMQLLSSENAYIQFAALHVLRLLSSEMYRQENGVWDGDDKVSVSGPKKSKLSYAVRIIAAEKTGWPAIMALDAALVPIQTVSSDAERVSMYDAIYPLVGSVLPQLLSRCPEQIPSSCEREYVTENQWISGPECYPRYAIHLLYRVLSTVPAVVRSWYNSLPNNATQMVNKYVKRTVSKYLIESELNKVKIANLNQLKGDKLLKIRVVPASGEVVAEYTVEETTMRLCIGMPSDWPLSVPSIQLDKAVVPTEKAKKWLLQLTAYLFHQNGSTVDGVIMWRQNVDRDVEGAEACTICMMTIHSNSHQLPKVKCKQCKNKFHSNCLYKWFESSNQSSCPLCRTNFT